VKSVELPWFSVISRLDSALCVGPSCAKSANGFLGQGTALRTRDSKTERRCSYGSGRQNPGMP